MPSMAVLSRAMWIIMVSAPRLRACGDGVVEQARAIAAAARALRHRNAEFHHRARLVTGGFEGQVGHGQHLEAAVEDAEDEVALEIDVVDVAADLLVGGQHGRSAAGGRARSRPAGGRQIRGSVLGAQVADGHPGPGRTCTRRAGQCSFERFGLACHAGFRLLTKNMLREGSRVYPQSPSDAPWAAPRHGLRPGPDSPYTARLSR